MTLGGVLGDPVDVGADLGVDTGEPVEGAAHAPTDDAALDGLVLAHEGAAGVALAGVEALLAGADHVLDDDAAEETVVVVADCEREEISGMLTFARMRY